MWAIGVVTYFLLCGYTPFDRDTQKEEIEAIITGDYNFEPREYWEHVSDIARAFVKECLTLRLTAAEALQHKWLAAEQLHLTPDPDNSTSEQPQAVDLLTHI